MIFLDLIPWKYFIAWFFQLKNLSTELFFLNSSLFTFIGLRFLFLPTSDPVRDWLIKYEKRVDLHFGENVESLLITIFNNSQTWQFFSYPTFRIYFSIFIISIDVVFVKDLFKYLNMYLLKSFTSFYFVTQLTIFHCCFLG